MRAARTLKIVICAPSLLYFVFFICKVPKEKLGRVVVESIEEEFDKLTESRMKNSNKGSVEIERIIDRENIITKQLTSKLTEFVPNVHRKQTMRDLRD